mmetsp:Transcript_84569/g.258228  ORF Transcript_84569/g.258228 Transcript_84569/m.258228 type:complete len:455 (-) Transcript_84569:231-1595(-)
MASALHGVCLAVMWLAIIGAPARRVQQGPSSSRARRSMVFRAEYGVVQVEGQVGPEFSSFAPFACRDSFLFIGELNHPHCALLTEGPVGDLTYTTVHTETLEVLRTQPVPGSEDMCASALIGPRGDRAIVLSDFTEYRVFHAEAGNKSMVPLGKCSIPELAAPVPAPGTFQVLFASRTTSGLVGAVDLAPASLSDLPTGAKCSTVEVAIPLPTECGPDVQQDGSTASAWVVHPLSASWAILECRKPGASELGGLFVSRWRSGAPGLGLEATDFHADRVAASPTRDGGLVLAYSNFKSLGPQGLHLFRVWLPANDTASGDGALPRVAAASLSWGEFAECYAPGCSFAQGALPRAHDIGDGASEGRLAVTFTRSLNKVLQNCLAVVDWDDLAGWSWRLYAFEGDAKQQFVGKVVRSRHRDELMIELVRKATSGYNLLPAAIFRTRLPAHESLAQAI